MRDNVTDQGSASTAPDLERIVSDLASLKRDLAELFDHVKSGAVGGVGDATDAVRRSVGLLGDKARSAYDDVAAQGERSVKAIGRQVEERPITSLLIALGVGFVASRLLSRRAER
ncbi:MAG TPA: hypothetical protein VN802_18455 [Stellaceae bacterium]|nr:hypothetical protein [Stellaceae bacterium]